MAQHKITTPYTNRLGMHRTDVRIVQADDDDELHAHMRAAVDEVQNRPGVRRCTGTHSEPI